MTRPAICSRSISHRRSSAWLVAGLLAIAAAGITAPAQAVVTLFEWGFNIDGTVYGSAPSSHVGPGESDGINAAAATLPASIDDSTFDFSSGGGPPVDPGGLGTIRMTVDGTGVHAVGAYFDHELDESSNTFFNETGAAVGTVAAGQSWEINRPGGDSPPLDNNGIPVYVGDIYDNFFFPLNPNGLPELDNLAFFDAFDTQTLADATGGAPEGPVDVAMAMAWDFMLADGERAIIEFIVSEVQPNAGFYLQQSDLDTDRSIYFYSTLSIQDVATVPAPTTLLLLGLGFAGIAARRRVIRVKAGC